MDVTFSLLLLHCGYNAKAFGDSFLCKRRLPFWIFTSALLTLSRCFYAVRHTATLKKHF